MNDVATHCVDRAWDATLNLGAACIDEGLMVLALSVILGLIAGSTASALAFRLGRGMPVVTDRSRCPGCGEVIRARDNVPIVSYLVLRGRCRTCKERIPWRYPMLELGFGAVGAIIWRVGAGPLLSIALGVAMLAAVVAALVDRETYRIPNKLTYPSAVIVFGLELARAVLRGEALDVLVPAGLMVAVVVGFVLVGLVSRGGMGLGDAKLAGLLALALGAVAPIAVEWMLLAAFASGALVGLVLVATRARGLRSRLPFGPFLAFGGLSALVLVAVFH